jgi:hypothetical protein
MPLLLGCPKVEISIQMSKNPWILPISQMSPTPIFSKPIILKKSISNTHSKILKISERVPVQVDKE